MHVVQGNNLGDPQAIHNLMKKSPGSFVFHGMGATLGLGGKRIFVTHYPHYGHGMACTGNYDLICYGHSHVAEIVRKVSCCGGALAFSEPEKSQKQIKDIVG